jgi:NAD(P)H-dependent FMN reductase
MNTPAKALLLVGSPKARSTSASLGDHLLGLLEQRGLFTDSLRLTPILRKADGARILLSKADGAGIIVLAFPLYVDSLPGPLVRALELLAEHRRAMGSPRRQRLLAISNCGFPEARHNETALDQCRIFCRDAGIEWVGGLGLGGGGMIGGLPLTKRGRAVRGVTASLALAADTLAADTPLPEEAVSLMARPLIPVWLYMLIGHAGWRRQARKFGALKKIYDRPYQDEEAPASPHQLP